MVYTVRILFNGLKPAWIRVNTGNHVVLTENVKEATRFLSFQAAQSAFFLWPGRLSDEIVEVLISRSV
jgi:hypothetical protein